MKELNVKLEVQEYGLYNFCKRIQECLDDGYRFDFDSNEAAPTTYGTMFVAVLNKTVEVKEEASEVQSKFAANRTKKKPKDNTEVSTEVPTETSPVEVPDESSS